MPKNFEFRNIKEISVFYKKLINELDGINSIKNECEKNIKKEIIFLSNTNFFASIVENELKNKKNIQINGTDNYIAKSYFYYKSCKLNEQKDKLKVTEDKIKSCLKKIAFSSNAFLWFLKPKNKKIEVENAYKSLERIKEEDFIEIANNLIAKKASFYDESLEQIKEEVNSNKSKIKKEIDTVNKGIVNRKIVPSISKKEKEYKSLIEKWNESKKTIEEVKKAVKANVEYLLAEELVNTLRGIPVEELSREKAGLKIKYLKEGGYDNLADVFGASSYELASVYGISQDAAYTIKRICDNYAKRIKEERKIQISYDNKTKTATKLVQSIFSYIKKNNIIEVVENTNQEIGEGIKSAINELSKVDNGSNWLFLSNEKKEKIKEANKEIEEKFNKEYKPLIEDNIFLMNKTLVSSDESWEHFKENSIEYFTIIEKLCPGVLSNEDSIYGLPEELARKIREECFFPEGLLCTLRKYQEWGVKYILHQEKVLLGDEMGLGKTIQAIASMVSLKNTGATHFMVVCPASVVTNWCREIIKHSKLRVTKIHGKGKKQAFLQWLKTGGVAVTNFESTSYIEFEENYKISMLIVDEAHYIKNETARRSINTRELSKHADRLLFMTGTALENNVDEMISLIDVLQPQMTGVIRSYAFMSSAAKFREKIAPVYYRRKREDVLTELPDKTEVKEWCTMNQEEEMVYENSILDNKFQEARRVSWSVDDLNKSSKAIRLKEIVEEAESEGRKVLVFSYFLDTISKIYEFLRGKCLNPITGSVSVNRRQEIIDEFDKSKPGTVLLAQINSGGTGLNIQSASVVVICEPQFKPSIENQAISRAYRMGQSRKVLVYRLLCEDTIDERMIDLLEEKQEIFDTFADKSVAAQAQLKEITDLTFGNIISEEIERINKKRGSTNVEKNNQNKNIYDDPKTKIVDKYQTNGGVDYYNKLMKMSYEELVSFLLNKYGPAKYDYFTNETCVSKNKKVTRTSEGLYCHHIDEYYAINLSEKELAIQHPFDYQKANRLVYCNILEHFLLHVLIAEETSKNNCEMNGVGGAVCYISKQLNDLYNGYEFKIPWMTNTMSVVKNDFNSYILMLNRLWEVIQSNPLLSIIFNKEELSKGTEGKVYDNIYFAIK